MCRDTRSNSYNYKCGNFYCHFFSKTIASITATAVMLTMSRTEAGRGSCNMLSDIVSRSVGVVRLSGWARRQYSYSRRPI